MTSNRSKLWMMGFDGPLTPKSLDSSWKPGYVGFSHSIGPVGRAIRQDQKWAGDYQWEVNHMFMLDAAIYNSHEEIQDWWVIQAHSKGVVRSKLSEVAPGGYYEIIPSPLNVNLECVVSFHRAALGAEYGFWSIASLVLTELTPRQIRFSFRQDGTWICSALGAEALRYAGWYYPWPDIYQVRPAQVRQALKEQSRRDKTHLRALGRDAVAA